MQIPMFEPESNWVPPKFEELPSWKEASRIAIDVETCDPHLKELGIGVRRGGYMVGVSFAIEDQDRAFYLPFRHLGGGNLEKEKVITYLQNQANVFQGELVGTNLGYDLDYLAENDINFSRKVIMRDINIADPLIYELHSSYSLASIAGRFKLPGKDEELLRKAAAAFRLDPKKELYKLHSKYVGAYAEADVTQPLLILRRQERLLEDNNLWDIWDLESKVLPVLVRMRRRGVLIDFDKLAQIEDWTIKEEASEYDRIHSWTGIRISSEDIWKAAALTPVLEFIGIPLGKTPTGKPKIDANALRAIDDRTAQAVLRARKLNKIRTTFASSIRRYETNGRIHCNIRQIAAETESGEQKGARFGRCSSIDPNLQQQPSRDKDPDVAGLWRQIYIPEPGSIWACNDYSQQEPRMITHFAAGLKLPGALEAAEAYIHDPKLDNHQFMSDITGIKRHFAKQLYLGLGYGEGGAKLARQLDLPTRWALRPKKGSILYFSDKEDALKAKRELGDGFLWEAAGGEAQGIIDQFNNRAPYIKLLAQECSNRAKRRGWVRTLGGRVLHFPVKPDGDYDWLHKALNRLIQGSSADQTKSALIKIDEEMPNTFMQLQVHDEIDSSCSDVAEAKRIGKCMTEAISGLKVPFRVDTEIGPNWGQLEKG